jgi:hypothetical protein
MIKPEAVSTASVADDRDLEQALSELQNRRALRLIVGEER